MRMSQESSNFPNNIEVSLQQNIHSVQFAVLHHAANLARLLDVGERISVDEDEVGKFTGLYAAEIACGAESVSGYCGRCLQRFERSEAGVHVVLQLGMERDRERKDR